MSDRKSKKLRRDRSTLDWTVDVKQIKEIVAQARKLGNVGWEETEAVILAMVDCGYAAMEVDSEP